MRARPHVHRRECQERRSLRFRCTSVERQNLGCIVIRRVLRQLERSFQCFQIAVYTPQCLQVSAPQLPQVISSLPHRTNIFIGHGDVSYLTCPGEMNYNVYIAYRHGYPPGETA